MIVASLIRFNIKIFWSTIISLKLSNPKNEFFDFGKGKFRYSYCITHNKNDSIEHY